MKNFLRNNLKNILSAIGIFLIVALLWLPFGLKTADIADGWLNLPKVERNSFVSLIDGPRPLVYLSWELGQALSDDSYMGIRIVLAALFWGKAFIMYMILSKLRLVTAPSAFLSQPGIK